MSKRSNATKSPLLPVSPESDAGRRLLIHLFPISQQALLVFSLRNVLDLDDCDYGREYEILLQPIAAESKARINDRASW